MKDAEAQDPDPRAGAGPPRPPTTASTGWWTALRWTLALVALYALAATLRLMLLDGPLYGDEAVQYAMSRHWGDDPDNVVPEYHLNGPLWWGRMMFPLVLSPGAAIGLTAFRVEHTLLASLLPVLVAGLAHRAGLHPAFALGAGAAIAIHPTFVLWGARVFPDTIMACFVVGALWAHVARRPVLAAGLFVAAVWTKETAGLALLAVFLWSLWKAHRAGEASLWPLRLDRTATGLLAAGLLAPWPLMYAVFGLQGRVPGWSEFALEWHHVADLFATAWLIVPILAGLAWPRPRPWMRNGWRAVPAGRRRATRWRHRGWRASWAGPGTSPRCRGREGRRPRRRRDTPMPGRSKVGSAAMRVPQGWGR
jgi:hypothetical protein